MSRAVAVLAALAPVFALAVSAQERADTIQRLDGSRISVTEAETFAARTLAAAHVTGAQIAVVVGGRPVWSGAFGLRRRDPQLPMTRETTTWAASITKGLFATYVMQLVERGEFALDVPLAAQLAKPLDAYQEYRETASGLVRDPRWPAVTPRMLLSHTSGLHNFAFFEPDNKMHLHFAPGSRYQYSGEGLNLLQLAIEERKGRSLDRLMHEAIFDPLGMTRTGLIYRQEFAADVADRFDADEKFHAQTKRFPARAAGSMTTSADDVARFAAALLAGRLLKPATFKAMLAPVIRIRTLHQFAIAANEPEGREAAAVGLAYGLGWGLLTRTRFGPAFFKEGHGDGAQNYMICFERSQTCMILLTNSDNGELAFRPLLERIIGNTVTPWEWEGYTPGYIAESRKQQ
jgi:CubicO group peptidase (beta-lactamase class C family)